MILIDFIYVNSPGGLNLASQILEHLVKFNIQNKFKVLLDHRNKNKLLKKKINSIFILNSEIERFKFYKKNGEKFKRILCFGNVPPPFPSKSKTYIFFHNELILSTKNSDFGYLRRINFWFKRKYIKSIKRNNLWIVQTNHMKNKISKILNVKPKNIFVYPIFRSTTKLIKKKKNPGNIFIYPTSLNRHKNNYRLIKAFINIAKSIDTQLTLKITLRQVDLNEKIKQIPKNLKIEFLGHVSLEVLNFHYGKSRFLIFPSLKESFALPLIEAAQSGLYILSSDLDYSNEIIEASKLFDPYSVLSIENSIRESISKNNLKLPRIKVKNSIENIFNKLLNV